MFHSFHRDICDNFSPGDAWGHNGPAAISRALKQICNVNEINEMKPKICLGFNVLSKEILYPIHWSEWEWLFDPSLLYESIQRTKYAVAVHFSNRLSSATPILKDFTNQTIVEWYKEKILKSTHIKDPIGETAYGAIARVNCPLAYNSSGIFF